MLKVATHLPLRVLGHNGFAPDHVKDAQRIILVHGPVRLLPFAGIVPSAEADERVGIERDRGT